MLKGIPAVLSPDLLKTLAEMGHGDEIVLADANFPAASVAQRLIRLDACRIPPLLDAVLTVFPLDRYVPCPVALMRPEPGDTAPDIWDVYRSIVARREGSWPEFEQMDRFDFYRRARQAFAVVATGDLTPYGNVILTKGVVPGALQAVDDDRIDDGLRTGPWLTAAGGKGQPAGLGRGEAVT